MQIIFITSPLGEIKQVNLSPTFFIPITISCLFILVFMVLGIKNSNLSSIDIGDFYVLPGKVGGGGSQANESTEQSRMNFDQINEELEKYAKKITQLESANTRLLLLATPPELQDRMRKYKGMGGPYLPIKPKAQSFDGDRNSFNSIKQELRQKNDDLDQSIHRLIQDIEYLERAPIGFPLSKRQAISSNYGIRVDPIKKQYGKHQGIDFSAPKGAIIVSAGAGVVEYAGWDKDYGNTVAINHGNGYVSRYAHASEIMVTPGQKVDRQMAIAKVGNTGRSTGHHLHFEILQQRVPINPNRLLNSASNKSTLNQ